MITKKEILEICQKEKIVFQKIIRETERFILILGKIGKSEVVLKILNNPKKRYAKTALFKEAIIFELLSNLKKTKIRIPKFLGKNLKGKYPYFFREFVTGKTLEAKSGFFFKELKKEKIWQIVRILEGLKEIPFNILNIFKWKVPQLSNFKEKYLKETFKLHPEASRFFLPTKYKRKFQELFQKRIKKVKTFAVHGEVYPNNLIEGRDGEIYLLDWENFGFGSLAHDTASIFLRLKKKKLQNFFWQKVTFKNEKDFKDIFPLEVVLQAIGSWHFFGEEFKKGKLEKDQRDKNQNYFSEIINKFLGSLL